MENKSLIDFKILHCKFFEHFISREWNDSIKTTQGLEIIRWKTLYWLSAWQKEIDNCHNCKMRLYEIKENFHNMGIKLNFEPEVSFK